MERALHNVLILLALAAGLTPAARVYAGEPTAQEQLLLQLINRLRADPVGELDRLVRYVQPGLGQTFAQPAADDPSVAEALDYFQVDAAVLRTQFNALTPAPPLAWSSALHDSARYYAQLMIERDQQSHTLDGLDLLQRVQRHGGFDFSGGGAVGENLFAYAESPLHAHAGFVIDWGQSPTGIQDPPGHRDSLLEASYREIGVAMLSESSPQTEVGPQVTVQHLAVDFADGPYLTGAVYRDRDRNQFYSLGEGLGGLAVELLPRNGLQVLVRTQTFGSGGYVLDLGAVSAGDYRVRLTAPGLDQIVSEIVVSGTVNLSLDIVDPLPQIDALTASVLDGPYRLHLDLDLDGQLTQDDRLVWVEELRETYFGDANLDGQFDSGDFVDVFQAGDYEDDLAGNSIWATGDWDGDREFESSDMVLAFQHGGYERGPRAGGAVVPEPGMSGWLLWLGIEWARRRRAGRHSGASRRATSVK